MKIRCTGLDGPGSLSRYYALQSAELTGSRPARPFLGYGSEAPAKELSRVATLGNRFPTG